MKNATRITCALVVVALIGPAAGASAHFERAAAASAPSDCGGAPDPSLTPSSVITGEFDTSREGSYVLLPFTVPAGATAVRVRYCYDQPEAPTNARIKHVLDLGLYDARPLPGALWGEAEFRGWGGSSHPDVTVSPNGFSSESEYVANPKLHRHGSTTRGFEPGPIPAGEWAVELGVAAVASQAEGDSDGKVAWRVEVDVSSDPLWADDPYLPAPYDTRPAQSAAGWYAGDFHVHAEHSSLGDATMRETFDYAFAPARRGRRRARLHHALRLRHRLRLGGDRPLPARLPGQADRRAAPRSSPTGGTPTTTRSAALRGLPHRPRLRAA